MTSRPKSCSRLVVLLLKLLLCMMTSSNGNIFRATGPLCGEFTGPGEFPTQRPVTRSFDVFFDLRLNKRLNKQSWGWWFETQSRPFWRHRNVTDAMRPPKYHKPHSTRWCLMFTMFYRGCAMSYCSRSYHLTLSIPQFLWWYISICVFATPGLGAQLSPYATLVRTHGS